MTTILSNWLITLLHLDIVRVKHVQVGSIGNKCWMRLFYSLFCWEGEYNRGYFIQPKIFVNVLNMRKHIGSKNNKYVG